jgi:hypothetical protein
MRDEPPVTTLTQQHDQCECGPNVPYSMRKRTLAWALFVPFPESCIVGCHVTAAQYFGPSAYSFSFLCGVHDPLRKCPCRTYACHRNSPRGGSPFCHSGSSNNATGVPTGRCAPSDGCRMRRNTPLSCDSTSNVYGLPSSVSSVV